MLCNADYVYDMGGRGWGGEGELIGGGRGI